MKWSSGSNCFARILSFLACLLSTIPNYSTHPRSGLQKPSSSTYLPTYLPHNDRFATIQCFKTSLISRSLSTKDAIVSTYAFLLT